MSPHIAASGGMSNKESRAFVASRNRGLADMERRAYKARVEKLDADLRVIKAEGRKRLHAKHTECADRHARNKKTARDKIALARLERDRENEHCSIEAAHVEAEAKAEAAIVAAKLKAERDHKLEMRRIEATNTDRAKEQRKATGGERLAESNEAVEANLSPREIVVWRRVRSVIKASDRQSRAESFQKYVHDSGGLRKLEADLGLDAGPSDAQLAREREQHENDRRASSGKRLLPGASRVSAAVMPHTGPSTQPHRAPRLADLVAESLNRHDGGVAVERKWGSRTVTTFHVYPKGRTSEGKKIEGFGASPGARATYAKEKYLGLEPAAF